MKRMMLLIFILSGIMGMTAQNSGSNGDCNGITSISESFEDVAIDSLPDCWSKLNPSNVIEPAVVGTNLAFGLDSKSVKFMGLHPQFLILPRLDIPLNGLQLKFKLNKDGIKNGVIQVGYMSDPTDSTTFVPLENYDNGIFYKAFFEKILYFDNVPDNGGANRFIAFRYGNVDNVLQQTNYYYWIDDVEVTPISSCPQPMRVNVTSVTTTSINISWTILADSSAEWQVEYKEASDTTWSVASPNVTINPEYTISGLTSATPYNIRVRTVCGASIQSDYTYFIGDVYTDCPYISSLNETFDDVTDVIPVCWSAITESSYSPKVVSADISNNLPSRSVRFAGISDQYLITPKFSIPLSTLQLNFKLNSDNLSNGIFQVGYMSDPSDKETFVAIENYRPDEYEVLKSYSLQLSNIPDNSGANRYLAFRYGNVDEVIQPTYYYYWLDDVEVFTVPSCLMVSDLEVSSITASSANISFTANTGEQAWQYVITDDMSISDPSSLTPVDFTTNPFTLTGLNYTTDYRLWVRANCGSGDGFSDYSSITFTTECEAVAIGNSQWTEDFSAVSSDTIPPCWNRTKSYDSPYGNYSYPTVTGSNGQSLMFGGRTTQIITTPCFVEDVNTLEIEFDLLRTSEIYSGQFEVGVLTDPYDENSFVLIQDITPFISNDNQYERFTVSLASAPAGVHYIGFRQTTVSNEYYYLDNIDLHLIPTCPRPSGLQVETVSENSASIAWIAGNVESAWTLEYKEAAATEWITVNVTNNSFYSITGLFPNSSYIARVKGVCLPGVDESFWTETISFETLCAPEELPFTESFSGVSTIPMNCWGKFNGLASSVFSGSQLMPNTSLAPYSNWIYGDDSNGLPAGKAKVNIYGQNTKTWLVTPPINVTGDNINLEFDLALTAPNSSNAPQEVPSDKKFMVIVSADGGATWSENNATVWSEDGTGDYVLSDISNTPTHISLNLLYNGTIKIAFYAESTSYIGSDVDLHLDNINLSDVFITPPTVVTLPADNITSTTASLHKNVIQGGIPITMEGFRYKVESDVLWRNSTDGNLTGLTSGTTYNFFAYVMVNGEMYRGDTLQFTTTGQSSIHPVVTTMPATNILHNSATLNKNVVADPSEPVIREGWKYKSTADNNWSITTDGSLIELEHNTQYEFYAFATTSLNSNGYNGDTLMFTTLSYVHPIVVTQAATDVQYTSATLNKNVVVDPSEPIVSEGWKYKAVGDNTWISTTYANITGLVANTQYEFYAFVTTDLNPNGYTGDTLTFTTLPYAIPLVTTQAATNITYNSATLNKVVVPGSENIMAEGFKYKVSGSAEWTTVADGNLTGLQPNTEYEFKAYASTQSYPIVEGDVLRFTTLEHSVGIDLVDCNVNIYPNPANEVVTIQIDGLDAGAEITLFDLQGKILINQTLSTGSNSLALNVADLADATYIVRIKSNNINLIKRLIIKK